MFDAVSNVVLQQYDALQSAGCSVEILYEFINPKVLKDNPEKHFRKFVRSSPIDSYGVVLIFHFSTFSQAMPSLMALPFAKRIAYIHNITPIEHAKGLNDEQIDTLRHGFKQLTMLKDFDIQIYNSKSTQIELREQIGNFSGTTMTIMPISARRYLDYAAKTPTKKNSRQIISIGRLVPNKNVERLIEILAEIALRDPKVRLIYVGQSVDPAYTEHLFSQVRQYGLEYNFLHLELVREDLIFRLIAESNLLISVSKHEGFCVPILEANLLGTRALVFDLHTLVETSGIIGDNMIIEASTENSVLAQKICFEYLSQRPYQSVDDAKVALLPFIEKTVELVVA